MDFTSALDDFSNDRRSFPELANLTEHGVDERWSNRQDETDAHVEHTVHLLLFDGAMVLEEVEDGRNLPAVRVDDRIDIIRKHSIEVAGQTSARDVGHGGDDLLDPVVPEDIHDGLTVDPSWLKEDLPE